MLSSGKLHVRTIADLALDLLIVLLESRLNGFIERYFHENWLVHPFVSSDRERSQLYSRVDLLVRHFYPWLILASLVTKVDAW